MTKEILRTIVVDAKTNIACAQAQVDDAKKMLAKYEADLAKLEEEERKARARLSCHMTGEPHDWCYAGEIVRSEFTARSGFRTHLETHYVCSRFHCEAKMEVKQTSDSTF